jgi:hypothetical protein
MASGAKAESEMKVKVTNSAEIVERWRQCRKNTMAKSFGECESESAILKRKENDIETVPQ